MDVSNIVKYFYMYEYLADKKKSAEDIKFHLEKELKVSAASVSRTMKSLRNNEIEMIASSDEMYFIDANAAKEFFLYLKKLFPVSEEDVLVKSIKKMKEKNESLQEEIEKLKKNLVTARADICDLKKANEKLKEERGKVSLESSVIFMDSVDIAPSEKFKERELLLDYAPKLDIEELTTKAVSKRESFYEMPKEELNEKTYQKKTLGGFDFKKLFEFRKKEIEEEKQVNEIGYSGDQEVVQRKNVRNRYVAIQKILDDKRMSNQQKLALYAFYSVHHGTDFESLINFVADANIDANSFIELVEASERDEDLENLKMLLRVLAKPSEVKQRLIFAKELLAGDWYIKASLGNREMKFLLVPELEIEMIKKKLGIEKEIEDKKEEIMQEKIKEKSKDCEEMIQRPSFVRTYNMDDDIEPDDYGFEEEAVSIDDVKESK